MKINCGISDETKFNLKQEWHRYFCWLPIRLGDHDCRWLEWIERKGEYDPGNWAGGAGWTWEYRALGEVIEN